MASARLVVMLLAAAFLADAKIKRDAAPPPPPPVAATTPANPMGNLLGATRQAVAMVIGSAADSVSAVLTNFQEFLIAMGLKSQGNGTPFDSLVGTVHAFISSGIGLAKDIKAANPAASAPRSGGGAQH